MTSGMVLHTKSYKVLEQDLKNGKDLNNICSKKVLGKNTIFFAEMLITTIEFFKNHFYNQGLTFFWLFKVTQPVEHVKWIKLNSI